MCRVFLLWPVLTTRIISFRSKNHLILKLDHVGPDWAYPCHRSTRTAEYNRIQQISQGQSCSVLVSPVLTLRPLGVGITRPQDGDGLRMVGIWICQCSMLQLCWSVLIQLVDICWSILNRGLGGYKRIYNNLRQTMAIVMLSCRTLLGMWGDFARQGGWSCSGDGKWNLLHETWRIWVCFSWIQSSAVPKLEPRTPHTDPCLHWEVFKSHRIWRDRGQKISFLDQTNYSGSKNIPDQTHNIICLNRKEGGKKEKERKEKKERKKGRKEGGHIIQYNHIYIFT